MSLANGRMLLPTALGGSWTLSLYLWLSSQYIPFQTLMAEWLVWSTLGFAISGGVTATIGCVKEMTARVLRTGDGIGSTEYIMAQYMIALCDGANVVDPYTRSVRGCRPGEKCAEALTTNLRSNQN